MFKREIQKIKDIINGDDSGQKNKLCFEMIRGIECNKESKEEYDLMVRSKLNDRFSMISYITDEIVLLEDDLLHSDGSTLYTF